MMARELWLLLLPALLLARAAGLGASPRAATASGWARFLKVADRYDAFLLDQFGVIHDGKNAYPGAAATVAELLQRGKSVVILSNSSRRRGEAAKKLGAMGFPEMPDIVTSGEAAWTLLRERPRAPFDASLGSSCAVFGNGEDDLEYMATAGVDIAGVGEADFLFARGLFCVEDGTADKSYTDERADAMLVAARERDLPMIVANPDFVRPDGKASPMPGVIAARYEKLGGTVHYIGKPHPMVYEQAFEMLAGRGIERSHVAAVGDSLLHDIRGAQQAGIDGIFVASGIHLKELALPEDATGAEPAEVVQPALDGLFREYSSRDAGIVCPPEHTVFEFADESEAQR